MKDNDDFKIGWCSELKDFLAEWSHTAGADDVHRFTRDEDLLGKEIEASIKSVLAGVEMTDQARNAVISQLADNTGYRKAMSTHRYMARTLRELLSKKRQLRQADIETKFRFLLFRTLTAIAIGTTILCVGYVAQQLQIPLPMLRPL